MYELRVVVQVASRAIALLIAMAATSTHVRAADCDGNGIEDVEDIASGRARDCDANGVPDRCDVGGLELATTDSVEVFVAARKLFVADFDGDHRADLGFGGENRFGVVSSRGDGSFSFPFVADGNFMVFDRMAVGDIDGDGLADVVAPLRRDRRQVAVWVARGDGTLDFVEYFPTGAESDNVADVACADFTGDGMADVIVPHPFSGGLVLLEAVGGGMLAEPQIVVESGVDVERLFTEDVDADGDLDLLVTGRRNPALLLFRTVGDGTFQPREILTVPGGAGALTVGDVDADGLRDILVGSESGVKIFRGLASGAFALPDDMPHQGWPADLDAGDLDGDGRDDVVTVDRPYGQISIYRSLDDGSFSAPSVFFGGDGAGAVRMIDLNGDGRPEIVTANDRAASLSILRNRGDGRFDGATAYPTVSSAGHLVHVDLNGDGSKDFVVASRDESHGRPSEYLSLEDGTLEPAGDLLAGYRDVSGVTAGDFDGDGDADLAIFLRALERDFLVAEGRGDGTFEEPQPLSMARDVSLPSFSGDVNEDGYADLVLAQEASDSSELIIFPGGSGGLSNEAVSVELGLFSRLLHLADVDRDGHLDLAVRFGDFGQIAMIWGEGGGEFAGPQPLAERPPDSHLQAVRAGRGHVQSVDLNGDGLVDLVATVGNLRSVAVLLGAGNRQFLPEQRYPAGDNVSALDVADVDGDGHPDVIVSDFQSDAVRVLRGTGTGSLLLPIQFGVGTEPVEVVATDLDLDDRPDVVVATRTSSLWVLRNTSTPPTPRDCNRNGRPDSCDLSSGESADSDASGVPDECESSVPSFGDCQGNGIPDALELARGESEDCDGNGIPDECGAAVTEVTFRSPFPWPTQEEPTGIYEADFDGDGLLDLVTPHRDSEEVTVLWGRGDGRFQRETMLVASPTSFFAVADMDGDGRTDIVSDGEGGEGIAIIFSEPGRQFRSPVSLAGPSDLRVIDAGDVDGDGVVDVVAARQSSLHVYRGTGNGELDDPVRIGYPRSTRATTPSPTAILIVDLDGDGPAEIVTANHDSEDLTVFRGAEDLGSISGRFVHPGGEGLGLVSADFDGDGRTDIARVQDRGDAVTIHRNLGDGQIGPSLAVGLATNLTAIAVADVDGDGIQDIVGAVGFHGLLTVFLGRNDATFTGLHLFRAGDEVSGVVAADFNGDGLTDIASADRVRNRVLVRLGRTSPVLRDDCNENGVPDACDLANGIGRDLDANGRFDTCQSDCRVPGDCDGNDELGLSDPICLLGGIFLGVPLEFPCGDGALDDPANVALLDWQADGKVNLSDAILALRYLFLGGTPHSLALAGEEVTGCVPIAGCAR